MVAPVTIAPAAVSGNPSASPAHRRAASSKTAVAGELVCPKLFWSQAPASQFDESVAGRAPPVTKPKYRPPALATVAGDPNSSMNARVSRSGLDFSGKPPSRAARSFSTAPGEAATSLSLSSSR